MKSKDAVLVLLAILGAYLLLWVWRVGGILAGALLGGVVFGNWVIGGFVGFFIARLLEEFDCIKKRSKRRYLQQCEGLQLPLLDMSERSGFSLQYHTRTCAGKRGEAFAVKHCRL